MSENDAEKPEKIQVEGIIEDDKVIVSSAEGIEEFYEGSYLGTLKELKDEQKRLILDSLEVLLLTERRRLILWQNNQKDGQQYDFEGLMSYFTQYDERLWHKYIVYMDLRKRGYIVRIGYGNGLDFRVFKRGANFREDTAKYLIYPVFEGSPIELRDLDKISRIAMSSRKDLIIATVDRLSKPTYYSVKKFQILNKVNDEDEKEVER